MIKATAKVGSRTVVIFGLSRENARRLLADEPILVELRKYDPRLPELTIVLCGGETEHSIMAELTEHFDVVAEWP